MSVFLQECLFTSSQGITTEVPGAKSSVFSSVNNFLTSMDGIKVGCVWHNGQFLNAPYYCFHIVLILLPLGVTQTNQSCTVVSAAQVALLEPTFLLTHQIDCTTSAFTSTQPVSCRRSGLLPGTRRARPRVPVISLAGTVMLCGPLARDKFLPWQRPHGPSYW